MLEIGGVVETYWKSLAVPHTAPAPIAKTATPRLSRTRQLGSAQLASPTGSPITVSSKAQPLTISSITGSYGYITVQVTQDLQTVVFQEWNLPQQDFDLWVAVITLAEFEALARRTGRELHVNSTRGGVTPSEWHNVIRLIHVSITYAMYLLRHFVTTMLALSVVACGLLSQWAYVRGTVFYAQGQRGTGTTEVLNSQALNICSLFLFPLPSSFFAMKSGTYCPHATVPPGVPILDEGCITFSSSGLRHLPSSLASSPYNSQVISEARYNDLLRCDASRFYQLTMDIGTGRPWDTIVFLPPLSTTLRTRVTETPLERRRQIPQYHQHPPRTWDFPAILVARNIHNARVFRDINEGHTTALIRAYFAISNGRDHTCLGSTSRRAILMLTPTWY